MNPQQSSLNSLPKMGEFQRLLAPYSKGNTKKAVIQLVNTLIPYVILWALAAVLIRISYLLALPFIILAAGFLVRIFIFFHDCGHNSFFPSTRMNRMVGFWLGVIVLTPSEEWWHSHAIHHATSGNLDKRGVGDVLTLTVDEYQTSSTLKRFGYRLFRNPVIMFGFGPLWTFILANRLPNPKYGKKETLNVLYTNLAILVMVVLLSLIMGWQSYLLIQLPVSVIGGALGIWMFYLQHQFGDVYWARNDQWDYVASALEGASFYDLPTVLRWFTGNIGYHHIHHLSPRIPNYYLDKCYSGVELLQKFSHRIPFGQGVKSIGLTLWDEKNGKLVRFKEVQPMPAFDKIGA